MTPKPWRRAAFVLLVGAWAWAGGVPSKATKASADETGTSNAPPAVEESPPTVPLERPADYLSAEGQPSSGVTLPPARGASPPPGHEEMAARFHALVQGLSVGAAQLRGLAGWGGEAKAAPEPPADRYAQLAEQLFDAQAPLHEAAVTTFLTVRPQDVTDKKVRGRIAKGYKYVAFETTAHTAEAVKGLVLWGGKFSAPLLIELLEKGTAGADEAIYDGLGTLATPEAAEAVVKRVGAAVGSEAIFACLRKMGPAAESPLIGALPFETPEANLGAITVLGEVGTRKSTAILREASKSENEEISAAALEAIRKIQERQRAATKANK
jgi:hypothetical protein